MSGNNTPLLTVKNQKVPGEMLLLTVGLITCVLTIASASIGIQCLGPKPLTDKKDKNERTTFLAVMLGITILILLFIFFRFYKHFSKAKPS